MGTIQRTASQNPEEGSESNVQQVTGTDTIQVVINQDQVQN